MVDTTGLGLVGRRTLVVGAGSGIGRATAVLLGQFGARVALGDIDAERGAAVAKEIGSENGTVPIVLGDVTEAAEADRVVNEAADALGGLDALINIVGMAAWGDLLSMTDATWSLELNRNLTQHLNVSRAAARRWIADGSPGRIAVVASVSGIYGAPNHGAYGAAKAGLMGLVRTMAQEWGPHGIRVNAVAPDMIATPRVLAAYEGTGRDHGDDAVADGASIGRSGVPEEIAGPLVFLVSDLSSYMTGQSLVVDGGTMTAFPHARGTTVMK